MGIRGWISVHLRTRRTTRRELRRSQCSAYSCRFRRKPPPSSDSRSATGLHNTSACTQTDCEAWAAAEFFPLVTNNWQHSPLGVGRLAPRHQPTISIHEDLNCITSCLPCVGRRRLSVPSPPEGAPSVKRIPPLFFCIETASPFAFDSIRINTLFD